MSQESFTSPEEFYSEHKSSIDARDKAAAYAADTQHRIDNDPLYDQSLKNDIEFRQDLQEDADRELRHAADRVDANLWRSQQHFNQNKVAYHDQASNDASAEGVVVEVAQK
jgi:hypothetical protein